MPARKAVVSKPGNNEQQGPMNPSPEVPGESPAKSTTTEVVVIRQLPPSPSSAGRNARLERNILKEPLPLKRELETEGIVEAMGEAKRARTASDAEGQGPAKRLACPFYRHSPSVQRRQSCIYPGFISIARLKFVPPFRIYRLSRLFLDHLLILNREHLYRVHSEELKSIAPGREISKKKVLRPRNFPRNKDGAMGWSEIFELMNPSVDVSLSRSPCRSSIPLEGLLTIVGSGSLFQVVES
jgi:hypothetical protein